jgi:hypothetical protein
MLLVSVPALLTPAAVSYEQLLVGGFFLGLAGSSFSAGVGFVSFRDGSPQRSWAARSVFMVWGTSANPPQCFSGRCWRFRSDGRTSFEG